MVILFFPALSSKWKGRSFQSKDAEIGELKKKISIKLLAIIRNVVFSLKFRACIWDHILSQDSDY